MWNVLVQVAEGLHHLHSIRVLHRDIKARGDPHRRVMPTAVRRRTGRPVLTPRPGTRRSPRRRPTSSSTPLAPS